MRTRRRLAGRFILAAILCLLPATVLGGAGDEVRDPRTVLALLEQDERFRTFAMAVKRAGFRKRLGEKLYVTVFAPTEAAFEALSAKTRKELLGNRRMVTEFVDRHLVLDDMILTPTGILASNGAVNPVERLLVHPDELRKSN